MPGSNLWAAVSVFATTTHCQMLLYTWFIIIKAEMNIQCLFLIILGSSDSLPKLFSFSSGSVKIKGGEGKKTGVRRIRLESLLTYEGWNWSMELLYLEISPFSIQMDPWKPATVHPLSWVCMAQRNTLSQWGTLHIWGGWKCDGNEPRQWITHMFDFEAAPGKL